MQFIAWTVGGLYFSWTDLDKVHGDHLQAPRPHLRGDMALVSPRSVLDAIRLREPVDSLIDQPCRSARHSPPIGCSFFSGAQRRTQLANATTGSLRSSVGRDEAVRIAQRGFAYPAPIRQVEYLTQDSVEPGTMSTGSSHSPPGPFRSTTHPERRRTCRRSLVWCSGCAPTGGESSIFCGCSIPWTTRGGITSTTCCCGPFRCWGCSPSGLDFVVRGNLTRVPQPGPRACRPSGRHPDADHVRRPLRERRMIRPHSRRAGVCSRRAQVNAASTGSARLQGGDLRATRHYILAVNGGVQVQRLRAPSHGGLPWGGRRGEDELHGIAGRLSRSTGSPIPEEAGEADSPPSSEAIPATTARRRFHPR